jgi:hypothetical protein
MALAIYPIGGVDFLPSLRPPDRRFVETRSIHLTGTTTKNILEPQISITPGLHHSIYTASSQSKLSQD